MLLEDGDWGGGPPCILPMPDTDTSTMAAANLMLLIRGDVLITHQSMPHVVFNKKGMATTVCTPLSGASATR